MRYETTFFTSVDCSNDSIYSLDRITKAASGVRGNPTGYGNTQTTVYNHQEEMYKTRGKHKPGLLKV